MELAHHNKVFVISGSSRGIGKGIAQVLLSEGAKVTITGKTSKDVEETASELSEQYPGMVLGLSGDLTDEIVLSDLRTKVLEKWSRIDGIVANAGSVKPISKESISHDDWNWYFNSNFFVATNFIQQFIDSLKESKGSIVCISSIAGVEDIGAPFPYNAAKAGLNAYAQSLASFLGEFSVRVNVVAPGNILFEGGNWQTKLNSDPSTVWNMIREKVPLRQFGKPEDVGNLVAFLLSKRADFITGVCIAVDGGQTKKFG